MQRKLAQEIEEVPHSSPRILNRRFLLAQEGKCLKFYNLIGKMHKRKYLTVKMIGKLDPFQKLN